MSPCDQFAFQRGCSRRLVSESPLPPPSPPSPHPFHPHPSYCTSTFSICVVPASNIFLNVCVHQRCQSSVFFTSIIGSVSSVLISVVGQCLFHLHQPHRLFVSASPSPPPWFSNRPPFASALLLHPRFAIVGFGFTVFFTFHFSLYAGFNGGSFGCRRASSSPFSDRIIHLLCSLCGFASGCGAQRCQLGADSRCSH